MKKILAIAAAAALTAGVSAYAANPFSDVSPDDWAYQAVSDLSDQGVVEGYPDGTFKGERNMTRYELAQVIARLMAREDQLNAEQKATLDKLAGAASMRAGHRMTLSTWISAARVWHWTRPACSGMKMEGLMVS